MMIVRPLIWLVVGACAACGGNGAPVPLDAGALQGAGAAAPATNRPMSAGAVAVATAGTPAAPPSRAGSNATAGIVAAGSGGARSGEAGTGGASGKAENSAGAAGSTNANAGMEPARSTGPGDWVAGDYPDALRSTKWLELKNVPGQDGKVRQYKVHVPPGYKPDVPAPVVFCIHGLGQDALLFCVDGANMPAKADSANFILVMPNGFENSWNGGTCCGSAATAKLDDIGLMRAIFADISKHLNIDLKRVFATGLSNGGYMSYRLACQAADLFAAVAPGAGAIGMDDIGGGTSSDGDFEACEAKAAVSVLDLHGTADPLIAYSTQRPSLERIAKANGCQTTTHPAAQPTSAGDTTCVSYDCPPGIDVTGCTVQGGGHVWFGSPNCGTGVDAACSIVGANSKSLVNTDAVWDFFNSHARK